MCHKKLNILIKPKKSCPHDLLAGELDSLYQGFCSFVCFREREPLLGQEPLILGRSMHRLSGTPVPGPPPPPPPHGPARVTRRLDAVYRGARVTRRLDAVYRGPDSGSSSTSLLPGWSGGMAGRAVSGARTRGLAAPAGHRLGSWKADP